MFKNRREKSLVNTFPVLKGIWSQMAFKILQEMFQEIACKNNPSPRVKILLVFGSFGLSTKEPYTIMLRPTCAIILHRWHQNHMCSPPSGIVLDIETSYWVHMCTYIPHICTSNI